MGALLPSTQAGIFLVDTSKFLKQHPTPGDLPLVLHALLINAALYSQTAVTT